VSNHPRGPLDLTVREAETFGLAMTALELVLGSPVVGVLLGEDDKLCLVPRPGVEVALLETLDTGSWKDAIRVAKEHCA
jgi:hypothetical protein